MAAVLFDPVSGAAGNMILGALLDLGAPLEPIRRAIEAGGVTGVRLIWNPEDETHGLRCAFFDVEVDHAAHHPHRRLADILDIIARADVSPRVAQRARAIFERLAEAEARVHGTTPDKIHFHEVGAEDAIVDVLGTCIALEALDARVIVSRPLKFGRGSVECAHGVLPVPVPAVVELACGFPVESVDVEMELTTPTGAAIVTTLAEPAEAGVRSRLLRCGVARGSRTIPGRNNIFRAFLLEEAAGDGLLEEIEVLETDIDDQTPEVTAVLCEQLRDAGALDVTMTPIHMKKNRPGCRLTIIAAPAATPRLVDLLFRESSTIGVRCDRVQRFALPRESTFVDTRFGRIRVKRIFRPDRVELVPELDDARRAAAENAVPLRDVMREAAAVVRAGEQRGECR